MSLLRSRIFFLLAAVLAGLPAAAMSAVLALAPVARSNSLQVIDVATRNSTVLQATSCCAVQAGSVAADVANDRVFFLSNRSNGMDLYTFGYAASALVGSIAITSGRRVTHLNYDAPRSRLVGFVAEDAGGIDVATIDPGNGNVVLTGVLGPQCCTLRSGISAYTAGADRLYAVGRTTDQIGTGDALFVFSVDGGKLLNSYALGSESILQLVVDGSTVYALTYNNAGAATRPAVITFSPSLVLTPIGAGTSDCCFTLAGPAAIDHAHNTLVALTRSTTGAGSFFIRAFSLSDGSVTTGNSVPAMGLFEDNAVLFDRIFADSFE
jgi:hypothetical protein